jgi:hypothetical protein
MTTIHHFLILLHLSHLPQAQNVPDLVHCSQGKENNMQVTVVRNFLMIQQSSRQQTGAKCRKQKFLAMTHAHKSR